jgi:hypothetical protein
VWVRSSHGGAEKSHRFKSGCSRSRAIEPLARRDVARGATELQHELRCRCCCWAGGAGRRELSLASAQHPASSILPRGGCVWLGLAVGPCRRRNKAGTVAGQSLAEPLVCLGRVRVGAPLPLAPHGQEGRAPAQRLGGVLAVPFQPHLSGAWPSAVLRGLQLCTPAVCACWCSPRTQRRPASGSGATLLMPHAAPHAL